MVTGFFTIETNDWECHTVDIRTYDVRTVESLVTGVFASRTKLILSNNWTFRSFVIGSVTFEANDFFAY